MLSYLSALLSKARQGEEPTSANADYTSVPLGGPPEDASIELTETQVSTMVYPVTFEGSLVESEPGTKEFTTNTFNSPTSDHRYIKSIRNDEASESSEYKDIQWKGEEDWRAGVLMVCGSSVSLVVVVTFPLGNFVYILFLLHLLVFIRVLHHTLCAFCLSLLREGKTCIDFFDKEGDLLGSLEANATKYGHLAVLVGPQGHILHTLKVPTSTPGQTFTEALLIHLTLKDSKVSSNQVLGVEICGVTRELMEESGNAQTRERISGDLKEWSAVSECPTHIDDIQELYHARLKCRSGKPHKMWRNGNVIIRKPTIYSTSQNRDGSETISYDSIVTTLGAIFFLEAQTVLAQMRTSRAVRVRLEIKSVLRASVQFIVFVTIRWIAYYFLGYHGLVYLLEHLFG